MNYIAQINRAIDYIEENLNTPLAIDQIALKAGISRWYFQRLFHAMVGETIKEYTLKRRLSLAAQTLLNSQDNILEIALNHGFESHEVFSRAFKRLMGCNPKAYRQSDLKFNLPPQKPKITLDYLTHLYGALSMEPTIKHLKTKHIIGITETIKSVLDHSKENSLVVAALWKRFETLSSHLPQTNQTEKFALISPLKSNAEESIFEYFAGVEIEGKSPLPEGFSNWTTPEGDYAEFTHQHQANQHSIGHTYNYIYGSWLPKSGRERGTGPEIAIYPRRFNLAQDAEIKILIPLV